MFLLLMSVAQTAHSQSVAVPLLTPLRLLILDSLTRQPVIGASAGVPGTRVGGQTDGAGRLTVTPAPGSVFVVQALGYGARRVRIGAPNGQPLILLLGPTGELLQEVVVTATRSNSRLEDLPTAVEVLGEEELIEEN